MKKKILQICVVLTAIYSSSVVAGLATGKVKSFYINKNGLVLLDLENASYQCNDGMWPLTFNLSDTPSREWISVILMADASDKALKVSYTDNLNGRCSVNYIYFID